MPVLKPSHNYVTYHVVFDDLKMVDVSGSLRIQVVQHRRHSTQNEPKKQTYSHHHGKCGIPSLL